MSLNNWKLLYNLKDSIAKLSNPKSFENVFGKDGLRVIQKLSSSINNELFKYVAQVYPDSTQKHSASTSTTGNGNNLAILPQWKNKTVVVSKSGISSQTQHVILSIESAENVTATQNKIEALISHIKQYPEGRNGAIRAGAIRILLKKRQKYLDIESIQDSIREALSLFGYAEPVQGRGIRVLSMDGGGIRGLLILIMLKKLEELTGKQVHELFDLICGVSTGAILSFSLGILHKSVDEIAHSYKNISMEVFTQSALWGTGNLVWNQAYYDTNLWETKLRDHLGSKDLISTSRDPNCPKLCAVSAVVNQSTLSAYVFRNYSLPWKVKSQYFGGNNHTVWEAARASAAVPTYFEEFKLGDFLHQDGGILVNNPTAVAVHEAKLIWANTPIQCVVSFGTGRTVPISTKNVTENFSNTSWSNKFYKILDSATDTEGVHMMLNDLLPDDVYYRFNPYLTEMISMVETDPKKLEQLERDAIMYLRRNEDKFQEAAKVLMQEKTNMQKANEYLNFKRDLYGLQMSQ